MSERSKSRSLGQQVSEASTDITVTKPLLSLLLTPQPLRRKCWELPYFLFLFTLSLLSHLILFHLDVFPPHKSSPSFFSSCLSSYPLSLPYSLFVKYFVKVTLYLGEQKIFCRCYPTSFSSSQSPLHVYPSHVFPRMLPVPPPFCVASQFTEIFCISIFVCANGMFYVLRKYLWHRA